MAGDWIKMRVDLATDPAVSRIAAATHSNRFETIGRLHAFWSWVDRHAVDGHVDGATLADVDEVTHKRGFAAALIAVNWLVGSDLSTGLTIPKHSEHNGESAKERANKNKRQAKWRERKRAGLVDGEASTPVGVYTSTAPSTREEKRRVISSTSTDTTGKPAAHSTENAQRVIQESRQAAALAAPMPETLRAQIHPHKPEPASQEPEPTAGALEHDLAKILERPT